MCPSLYFNEFLHWRKDVLSLTDLDMCFVPELARDVDPLVRLLLTVLPLLLTGLVGPHRGQVDVLQGEQIVVVPHEEEPHTRLGEGLQLGDCTAAHGRLDKLLL